MRYLKGTLHLALMFKSNNEGELVGFSDADWAGDVNDCKSTSGYVFLVVGLLSVGGARNNHVWRYPLLKQNICC